MMPNVEVVKALAAEDAGRMVLLAKTIEQDLKLLENMEDIVHHLDHASIKKSMEATRVLQSINSSPSTKRLAGKVFIGWLQRRYEFTAGDRTRIAAIPEGKEHLFVELQLCL